MFALLTARAPGRSGVIGKRSFTMAAKKKAKKKTAKKKK